MHPKTKMTIQFVLLMGSLLCLVASVQSENPNIVNIILFSLITLYCVIVFQQDVKDYQDFLKKRSRRTRRM